MVALQQAGAIAEQRGVGSWGERLAGQLSRLDGCSQVRDVEMYAAQLALQQGELAALLGAAAREEGEQQVRGERGGRLAAAAAALHELREQRVGGGVVEQRHVQRRRVGHGRAREHVQRAAGVQLRGAVQRRGAHGARLGRVVAEVRRDARRAERVAAARHGGAA